MSDSLKVLYISDSLGTPIHPRGIFNFSLSFIEVLKSLGMHVTLLVEGAPGYGIRRSDFDVIRKKSKSAIDIVQVAEILRYFYDGKSIRWYNIRNRIGGVPVIGTVLVPLIRAVKALEHYLRESLRPRKLPVLDNPSKFLGVLPQKIAHLELIDHFMVGKGIYTASISGGANGFAKTSIDASGFDLVVVDTPHYIRVTGIDTKRILSVVHDIIPIHDPTMSEDWRALFLRKVESTLSMDATMIFVSKTTRDAYYTVFDGATRVRNAIIYPPIRKKLMDMATKSASATIGNSLLQTLGKTIVRGDFNATLPFFVTPTSDEPRKNIEVLIKAFRHLRGVANLVIVGEVSPEKYIGPDDHSNILFTGYTTDAVKNNLIRISSGLIFPSLSEGFGIPLVEGGVLRRPVICSRIPVFEEISNGMAIYFDPHESGELIDAVLQVINEPEICGQRAQAYFEFIRSRFSQAAMTREVRALLESLDVVTK